MSSRSTPALVQALTAGAFVVLCSLFSNHAHAQSGGASGPFSGLSGSWSGAGTVTLARGDNERIRCRSTYRVAGAADNLQFNLRCASDSYTFDLNGNFVSQGGALSGTWSETSRSASGRLSGTASNGLIQARAEGGGFVANLALSTRGERQSLSIRSQGTELTGASVSLAKVSR